MGTSLPAPRSRPWGGRAGCRAGTLRRRGCLRAPPPLAPPGRLRAPHAWAPAAPRRPLPTADGIRHAAAEGVEIGSHGLTHVDLTQADDETLEAEVHESRYRLAELTGVAVDGFCYPYGSIDRRAMDAVRDAGYSYACAIDPGPLNGLHALPRLHIGENDNALRLYLKHRLHPLRRRPVEGLR